jgi:hypothetical protein
MNWQYDEQWGVWVDMDADGCVTSKSNPQRQSIFDTGYDWNHTETYDDYDYGD